MSYFGLQSSVCWLVLDLWQQLELDSFWRPRLRPSREGTPWLKVLKALVAYRLIDPGSEWRLHRQWFDASAMADVLHSDFAMAEKNTLYRCLDKLVEHKDELFKFLKRRGASCSARASRCCCTTGPAPTSRPTSSAERMTCASSATAATSAAIAGRW